VQASLEFPRLTLEFAEMLPFCQEGTFEKRAKSWDKRG
jgi:hypothetical protein